MASCWHFPRLADNVLDFFFTHWLHVGNKVWARWDQKVHQKLQKYAKKEFSEKIGKIYDLTLVPHPMLIKFCFLIFWHVILVYTFLIRP